MSGWTFLTNHGRALLWIARDPDIRLRDLATRLAITERRAYGIIADLTEAGYLTKVRDGRRNHYQIQAQKPLPSDREHTIGDILSVLVDHQPSPPTRAADEGAGER